MTLMIVITGVILLSLLFYYLRCADGQKPLPFSLTVKGCCTLVGVSVALAGALKAGGFAWVLFAGAFLCMTADVLLGIRFLAGMGCFALAHACFIAYELCTGRFHPLAAAAFVLVYALAFIKNRKLLLTVGKKIVPYALYLGILVAMWVLALAGAVAAPSAGNVLFAVGATLFAFSDLMLAYNIFGKELKWRSTTVVFTYFPAVYLLALSLHF